MKHTFEIKESIEVEFPHYRRYEFFFYKVLSPTKEVKVEYYPHSDQDLNSAAIRYDKICFSNTFTYGSYEITESEFNTTYDLAFDIIHSIHTK